MSSSNRPVDLLLADLGTSMGLDKLFFDENNGCLLQFDDSITVLLLYEPNEDVLYLFSFVGEVEERHHARAFQRMLEANYRWAETGGATLSLRPGESNVVLTRVMPLASLDVKKLENILGDFISAVEKWAAWLENPERAETDGKDKNEEQETHPSMLRA